MITAIICMNMDVISPLRPCINDTTRRNVCLYNQHVSTTNVMTFFDVGNIDFIIILKRTKSLGNLITVEIKNKPRMVRKEVGKERWKGKVTLKMTQVDIFV